MISKETIFRTSDNKTFTSESSATKHEKSLNESFNTKRLEIKRIVKLNV